jgi:hypothetical protein
VYQNGVKLVNGDDYTASDGATVTLATGAATGDSIVIVASFPRGLSDGYLKSEADAKYALIASPTFTGVATFAKGTSNGITIGDVSTNSNSVLRLHGTSAGRNWQIANNLNVAGIEFTPSTANGGTTYTTPTVTFLSSGNVGVGTTSPSARLHVSTSGTGIQEVEWLNNAQAVGADVGSALVFTGTSSNNGLARISGAFSGATTADGAYMAFSTRAVTSGTLTERARIDAAGNFGVGTTSPSAKVHVAGSDGNSSNEYTSGLTVTGTTYTTRRINLTYDSASDCGILVSVHTGTSWKPTRVPYGTVIVGTQAAVSGGGKLQLDGGITFPATQSASTDANTLDDYEEGTWTPTIIGSSTNPTITYGSQRYGQYTKVGRVCYFVCGVSMSAYSGGSGRVLVTGLPFTAAANQTGNGAPANTLVSNITLPGGYTQITNYIDPSTTNFNWLATGTGAAYVDLGVTAFTASTTFIVSGFYIVA